MALYRLTVNREKISDKRLTYIHGAEDIYKEFREEQESYDREHFTALYLDNSLGVLGIETLSIGSIDRAAVYPRDTIKSALLMQATSIVLMHNHPSGNRQPSAEDCSLTRIIMFAALTMQIKVVDHIIFAGDAYYSFAENGKISEYEQDYIQALLTLKNK